MHNKRGVIEYSKEKGSGQDNVIYTNKCRFRCIGCGYRSSAWNELLRHVSRSHLSFFHKGSRLNPFEYATVRNFYECQLCGERLLHDAWIIKRHNLKRHTRIVQYYKMASGVSDGEFLWQHTRIRLGESVSKSSIRNKEDIANDNAAAEGEDKENAGDVESRSGPARKSSRKIRENKRYLEDYEGEQEIHGEKFLTICV